MQATLYNTQGCGYFLHHSGMEDVSLIGLNAPSTLQRYTFSITQQTKHIKSLVFYMLLFPCAYQTALYYHCFAI